MTWWPSVPTSAVIAPTIAGSSSTTRIRKGRGGRGIAVRSMSVASDSDRGHGRQGDDEPRSVALGRLAPQPRADGFGKLACRVQPDPGAARRVRLAPRVGLKDALAPFLGNAGSLV